MNIAMHAPIRVLLVEDIDIVREGIRSMLDPETGIEVIAEAIRGENALNLIKLHLPEIVILKMNMPGMNGAEFTNRIKHEFPTIKVLMLSMPDSERRLVEMLSAGADAYLLKNASRKELVFAIKSISDNRSFFSPEFMHSLLAKYKAIVGIQPTEVSIKLSDREMDVLKLIADGLTNTEMARTLFTSVRTIETRRKKLLDKTGTTNTATLIKFCVSTGLSNELGALS
jgi:DNA-binding NarL/FixJ family response regulator